MSKQTQSRSIETAIEIEAPIEVVWKALTDGDELANWFPLKARVQPGKGGSVWVSWGEGLEFESPIDVWEPNRHLRLIQAEPTAPPAEGEDPPALAVPFQIAVDYHLEAAGGQTVLRLVHTGFSADASWDNQYDGTVRGWAFELRGLKHYLERHRSTKREVVHAKASIEGMHLDEAWNRMMSPEGLLAEGDLTGRSPGDRYAIATATGERLEGEIQINNPPKDLAATVESLNDAFLRLRIDEGCHTAPHPEVNFWLSTYGLPPQQLAALQTSFESLLSELFEKVSPGIPHLPDR